MRASACAVYTVFDTTTRLPVSRVTCAADQLPAQLAEGQIALAGKYDMATTRLNDDGEPVQDAARAASVDSGKRRDALLVRIAELERKQLRPMRELAIDPTNADASRRLADIEAQIVELRQRL